MKIPLNIFLNRLISLLNQKKCIKRIKDGYLERMHSLNELRKKHEMISNLFQRQENKAMKDLNQFTKEYIDNANQQNKGTLGTMNEKKDC